MSARPPNLRREPLGARCGCCLLGATLHGLCCPVTLKAAGVLVCSATGSARCSVVGTDLPHSCNAIS